MGCAPPANIFHHTTGHFEKSISLWNLSVSSCKECGVWIPQIWIWRRWRLQSTSYQLFTKVPLHVQAWINLLSALTPLSSKSCIFSVLTNFLKSDVTLKSHVMDRIYLLQKNRWLFCIHSVLITESKFQVIQRGIIMCMGIFTNSLSTAIFCIIAQQVVVISYRHFGTTYQSYLHGLLGQPISKELPLLATL
jgi:hypothetical protein